MSKRWKSCSLGTTTEYLKNSIQCNNKGPCWIRTRDVRITYPTGKLQTAVDKILSIQQNVETIRCQPFCHDVFSTLKSASEQKRFNSYKESLVYTRCLRWFVSSLVLYWISGLVYLYLKCQSSVNYFINLLGTLKEEQ